MPDFVGSANTKLRYKDFSLYGQLDFSKGGHVYSYTNYWGKYSGLLEETAANGIRENGMVLPGVQAVFQNGSPVIVDEGNPDIYGDEIYQSNGTNTTSIPALCHFQHYGNDIQKAHLFDASFLKLRELSLSYSLPKKLVNKAKMEDITFSLFGRNLAILKKNVPHIDPEMAPNPNNFLGTEIGQNPSTRVFGVQLTARY